MPGDSFGAMPYLTEPDIEACPMNRYSYIRGRKCRVV